MTDAPQSGPNPPALLWGENEHLGDIFEAHTDHGLADVKSQCEYFANLLEKNKRRIATIESVNIRRCPSVSSEAL